MVSGQQRSTGKGTGGAGSLLAQAPAEQGSQSLLVVLCLTSVLSFHVLLWRLLHGLSLAGCVITWLLLGKY